MAVPSSHHMKTTNGKGKCSVPMWSYGSPSGFCDKEAFGEQKPGAAYQGYIPGLACPQHGGPTCPGIEIEPGVWSGCNQSAGDCPTCGK